MPPKHAWDWETYKQLALWDTDIVRRGKTLDTTCRSQHETENNPDPELSWDELPLLLEMSFIAQTMDVQRCEICDQLPLSLLRLRRQHRWNHAFRDNTKVLGFAEDTPIFQLVHFLSKYFQHFVGVSWQVSFNRWRRIRRKINGVINSSEVSIIFAWAWRDDV